MKGSLLNIRRNIECVQDVDGIHVVAFAAPMYGFHSLVDVKHHHRRDHCPKHAMAIC